MGTGPGRPGGEAGARRGRDAAAGKAEAPLTERAAPGSGGRWVRARAAAPAAAPGGGRGGLETDTAPREGRRGGRL